MVKQSEFFGTVLILGSAVGFGLNPMLAQILFKQGLSAEMITLARFALPAVVLLPFLRLHRTEWPEAFRMLALGAVNGVAILLYFRAIDVLPAATAILIYYTYPVFNVIIGWLIFGRRPTRNALAAAALILVAASLTIHPESLPSDALNAIMGCFLAPLVFAFVIQYLASPIQVVSHTNRLATSLSGHVLVLLPLAISNSAMALPDFSWPLVGALLALGIFAAAIPQLLFTMGAPLAGPERTSIAGACEMIIAMVTGTVLLGQNLDRFEATAIILIMIALFIRQDKSQPLNEPQLQTKECIV
ncbi:MAG: drug/metabolite transporter (DMT)-like permease [Parasphingorhabdus sp.]|jgi:drug/metabolite transporter (DMT)-like permease